MSVPAASANRVTSVIGSKLTKEQLIGERATEG